MLLNLVSEALPVTIEFLLQFRDLTVEELDLADLRSVIVLLASLQLAKSLCERRLVSFQGAQLLL